MTREEIEFLAHTEMFSGFSVALLAHDTSQRTLISQQAKEIAMAGHAYQLLAEAHEQQAKEIAKLREAMELYKRASYQSHSGHWDKTGGSGSGCPACLEARDLRNQAAQAMEEEHS